MTELRKTLRTARRRLIPALAVMMCGCWTAVSTSSTSGPDQSGDASVVADKTAATATSNGFSLDAIPISTTPLGAFPFIGLPEGYEWGDNGKGETRDFDMFPFWTGSGIQEIEGKLFMSGIFAKSEKTYSQYEIRKNIEALVAQAGGVRLTKGMIPDSITSAWGDEIKGGRSGGIGDVYNRPTEVFVIRRHDHAIWVHFVTDDASGNMAVVETKPFAATAKLLPADALERSLATDGKAVVHVNFATDETQILPDSRPQLDAIIQVLKQQPALRLAINGYTDETGTPQHNLKLSAGRAAAVRQALISAGIAASRLTSQGFGSSGAIAENVTDAGRSKNRRVELVRR